MTKPPAVAGANRVSSSDEDATKDSSCVRIELVSQAKTKTQEESMDTHSLAHTKWECQYHIVFIPKYRQKRLHGEIRQDIREIIKVLCGYKKVEIINGAVCKDHIHLHLSIPPKLSVSEFMGYLKGKSALMIYDKHPGQRSKWNKSFWARGYYVATIGAISEETIRKYIIEQTEIDRKEDKVAL